MEAPRAIIARGYCYFFSSAGVLILQSDISYIWRKKIRKVVLITSRAIRSLFTQGLLTLLITFL